MIRDRVRGGKSRGSSGWRRRLTRGVAAGLSVVGLAVFLSACTATPNFVVALANRDGTITLSWADVSDDAFACPTFDGYAVYMSTTPGGEDTTGTPLGAIPVNNQVVTNTTLINAPYFGGTDYYEYTVTGLQPGTVYYFEVLTIGELPSGNACIASPSMEMSATTAGQPNAGLQVILTWQSTADLDLHVLEPNGTEIYYGNTVSSDGGTYGIDANGGCSNTTTSPAETVTWQTTPPSGTYTERVEYYEPCPGTGGSGPQNFTVTLKSGGNVVGQQNGTVNSQGDDQDFQFTVS